MRRASRLLATLVVIAGTVAPAHSDEFTAADVLGWSRKSQDSYFQKSITMASFIATQNAGDHAECIEGWYFEDGRVDHRRNDQIRSDLKRFSNYHPTAVILARLEKVCGSLIFAQ